MVSGKFHRMTGVLRWNGNNFVLKRDRGRSWRVDPGVVDPFPIDRRIIVEGTQHHPEYCWIIADRVTVLNDEVVPEGFCSRAFGW